MPAKLVLVLVVLVAVSVVAGLVVSRLAVRRGEGSLALHDAQLVEQVNERAWLDRDVAPTLATALIDRVRDARQHGVPDARLLDDLRELAWQHRETDPELSVVVLDLLGRGR